MPLYDFRCQECEQIYEVWLSLKEKEEGLIKPCPQCGSEQTQQIFSSVGYVRRCAPNSGGGFT